jgi:hypothetical protein
MSSKGSQKISKFVAGLALSAGLLLTSTACATEPERLFIIGQDLGSVRDYMASDCCPQPDGNTAYLSFYNLLSPEAGFGGLGIDAKGTPLDTENDWGGGPVNAWKSATEFGHMALAIGLSLVENEHPGALDRLVAGGYDDNIQQLVRFLSLINNTVYLRIGYEFDGAWNQGYHDRERYAAAYRRIADGIRHAGLNHVRFVWQAAVLPLDEMIDGFHEDLPDWYPGDEYVDWVGLSLFVGLDERPAVATDAQPPTARELIDELLAFARDRGKPVMIAEAAPQGYHLSEGFNAHLAPAWDGPQSEGRRAVSPDDIWKEWYAPMFEFMEQNADVIQALAYINCHWDVQDLWDAPYEGGYWGDSRLQVSPEIARRFSSAINHWKAY